jgi:cellulose biosynthesis protein BcsQ
MSGAMADPLTRRAYVYCFASAKGGAGKTSIAASVAELLVDLQFRVLLIDADASTNGLTLLYLRHVVEARGSLSDSRGGAKGLFEVDASPATPLRLPNGASLVPAAYVMHQTDDRPPSVVYGSLLQTIASSTTDFDFILIDAQAGADQVAGTAIQVADTVVVLSEYDPVSAAGVERLKSVFRLEFERTWTLYNKVLPESAQSVGDPLGVTHILPAIAWDADVVRALVQGELAVNSKLPNAYTIAIADACKLLLPPGAAQTVTKWLEGQRESIRAPRLARVQLIDNELAEIERRQSDLALTAQTRASRIPLSSVVPGFVGVAAAALAALTFLLQRQPTLQAVSLSMLATLIICMGVAGVLLIRAQTAAGEGIRAALLEQRAVDMHRFRLRELRRKYVPTDATLDASDVEVVNPGPLDSIHETTSTSSSSAHALRDIWRVLRR